MMGALQTVTNGATVSQMYRDVVQKYGIQSGDMLMLWECIRDSAEDAARKGFREGFQMAQTIAGVMHEDLPPVEVCCQEQRKDPECGPAGEKAYVRIENSKSGKRLHFNKAARAMFGDYQYADIFVKGGKLHIYPTNDGEYKVVRTSLNGHLQICCADVVDALQKQNSNWDVYKRDNHIIARAS